MSEPQHDHEKPLNPHVEQHTVERFSITRLTPELIQQLGSQLTDLHVREWQKIDLCTDPNTPESQADQFDPTETFVVVDTDTGELVAQINTVTTAAESLEELCQQFPTYADVVSASRDHVTPSNPARYRICFSITARQDQRLLDPQSPGGHVVSPAGTLLRELGQLTPEIKIAYSRFGNVPPTTEDFVEFYVQQLRLSMSPDKTEHAQAVQALGAVGMHEHLGGITNAILLNGRPEDMRGGGMNVLVQYPRDDAERKLFSARKEDRAERGIRNITRTDSYILFEDI